jgi:hypothetical protein
LLLFLDGKSLGDGPVTTTATPISLCSAFVLYKSLKDLLWQERLSKNQHLSGDFAQGLRSQMAYFVMKDLAKAYLPHSSKTYICTQRTYDLSDISPGLTAQEIVNCRQVHEAAESLKIYFMIPTHILLYGLYGQSLSKMFLGSIEIARHLLEGIDLWGMEEVYVAT